MAEVAKIDLELNGSGAATTLGELKDNAEKLNTALEQAQIGSAQYKKLNQELIKTNTEVKNLELGFEALDKEQVASELGSVAGAIGDITTATILLGGENETLKEMAANIEKALGVSMAFKGAIEGMSSAQKLLNNQLQKGGIVTKIATAAQSAFNVVMSLNPIGLVVAAVVALIGVFVLLALRVKAIGNFFVDLGAQIHNVMASMGAWKNVILVLLGPIGLLIAAWDYFFGEQLANMSAQRLAEEKAFQERLAQGKEISKENQKRLDEIKARSKAEKEAHNNRQEVFDLDIARMEAEGQNSDALKRAKIQDAQEFAQFQLESINEQIASWTLYYEDLFVLSGKSREDFIAQMKGQGIDIEVLQAESLKAIEEQNKKIFQLDTERIAFERGIREKNQAEKDAAGDEDLARQERINARIKAGEEALIEFEKDLAIRRQAAADETAQIRRDRGATEFELELNQLKDEHTARLELLSEIIPEENELRLELIQNFEDAKAEIEANEAARIIAAEEAKQEELAAIRQQAIDGTIAGATSLLNSIEAINTMAHKRDIDRIKKKQANGERLTASEIKRLKKQEAIEKAFALVKIAVDTATAVAGAISSGASQPYPLNLVAIVTGVAAVLAGVAAAYKALGGGSAPAGVSAPSIEQASENTENQANGAPVLDEFSTGSSLLNAPQQVVVVEDINDGQNSVAAIEASATFG